MRRILTLLMVLGMSSFAWADFDEGMEYELLVKAQPAPTDGKVEVIEFFSYACPHCYRFEPYIEKWQETKSDNIVFIHVPAVFNKNWEALASLYYAAEVLGIQEKMHLIIFEAMHGEGKKIRSFDEVKGLFEANGVSSEKLDQALNSFTVAAKTRRAKSMTESYGIKSVPNIVVQGKYRTNGTLAKSHDNVFNVVDHLTDKIEKESKN
ncbi:MAG: thiol:disulfide interchange protein DsbA/DsbL [Gammaproteobacteria bacterium]|nr:thiol:disulfide interchange protein DsbA/DsbL [Gammaproteobacteria bacterium]